MSNAANEMLTVVVAACNEADALPRGRILHYGRAMGRLQ